MVTVRDTPLGGVKLVQTRRFADDRGWLLELWNDPRYHAAGLPSRFAQANVSFSEHGALRGMHYQWTLAQGKLVTVLTGSVFDVAVDIRAGSATFGRWFGAELSAANGQQLWIPEGFAHGFLVLSDGALVHYACTAVYDSEGDRALAWNDPDVGIDWPVQPQVVSARDRQAPLLRDIEPVRPATDDHAGSR
jgi:dTDP-4-dehydrorhamnose 3,5-epimerase